MAKKETYTIPHIGLKKEVHTLEYQLGKEFFLKYENELMSNAEVNVKVLFDKTSTPYILDFSVKGILQADCDKCATSIPIHFDGDFRVYVKFVADEEVLQDDNLEILFIHPDEPEIELESYLYDFVNLSVPYSRTCGVPGNTPLCDQIVLALLNQLREPEDITTTDPRWEGLNKLKDLN
jgi:uncharacterized metal-binding protein YceD (DUF177 family)